MYACRIHLFLDDNNKFSWKSRKNVVAFTNWITHNSRNDLFSDSQKKKKKIASAHSPLRMSVPNQIQPNYVTLARAIGIKPDFVLMYRYILTSNLNMNVFEISLDFYFALHFEQLVRAHWRIFRQYSEEEKKNVFWVICLVRISTKSSYFYKLLKNTKIN